MCLMLVGLLLFVIGGGGWLSVAGLVVGTVGFLQFCGLTVL